MKCIVVHRRDMNNVGDIASQPMQYFLDKKEYKVIDIDDIGNISIDPEIPIIVGGGGLIHNEFFGENLRNLTIPNDKNEILSIPNKYWKTVAHTNQEIRDQFMSKLNDLVHEYIDQLDNTKTPRILWGVGTNKDQSKKSKEGTMYPDWLRNFNVVGVRDFNTQYQWVPCASCMHPALQKKYPIKNKVIWFEHKKQLLKSADLGHYPIPRFINSGDNIEQTIEILGSAEVILTNSYHGAYWGTLLKKKVIVIEPWSSKFFTFKHAPYMLTKHQFWRDVIDQVPIYENALNDCINATQKYWKMVKGYLG